MAGLASKKAVATANLWLLNAGKDESLLLASHLVDEDMYMLPRSISLDHLVVLPYRGCFSHVIRRRGEMAEFQDLVFYRLGSIEVGAELSAGDSFCPRAWLRRRGVVAFGYRLGWNAYRDFKYSSSLSISK
jgi:hypothetical protein